MTSDVQDVVDDLAERLHRSVVVDDAELRLVASSAHFEEADPARIRSLVDRAVTGKARDYLLAAGIMGWQRPQRTLPDSDAGSSHARVCFPLRSRYELLGFMTIIEDQPLADDEMSAAGEVAAELVRLLAERARAVDEQDRRTRELVTQLLGTSSLHREGAAHALREMKLFDAATRFTVVSVSLDPGWLPVDEGPWEVVVHRATSRAARTLATAGHAWTVSEHDAHLVLGHRTRPPVAEMMRLGRMVHDDLTTTSASLGGATIVGFGHPQDRLESAVASARQAACAIRVGRARGESVSGWGEPPVDALLGGLLVDESPPELLPQVLRDLAREPAEMLSMLETFLDHAGNVVDTAEQLHLHRTTIYYRLRRVQELTGLDLNDGQSRLMLHLWLKARRYADTRASSQP